MSDPKEQIKEEEIKKEENENNEEPVIEDEKPKREKKTTLKYKIDPLVSYFPESANADKLKEIRQQFVLYKYENASKMADEFLKEEGNNGEDLALRINYWKAKTLYLIGDYKNSL